MKVTEELPEWVELSGPDEEETVRKELSACLAPMIQRLPDRYRTAIQLSEIEGKTQKEVAAIESISLSGAKSRVQRGRLLLKAMLQDCCEIELNDKNQLLSFRRKREGCDCD